MAVLVSALLFSLLVIGSCKAATVKAGATPLRFFSIGDWGGTETPLLNGKTLREKSVGKDMASFKATFEPSFVTALGDNFYSHGIPTDVTDKRFKETFEQVFDKLNLPFYVVAGNHDHRGNVSAEVAYSDVNPRWKMPSLYYDFTVSDPGKTFSLQWVMIDTVVLSGQSLDWDHDPIPIDYVNTTDGLAAQQTQMEWLEATLAASTADWLIVAGHYPVYSIAEHGPTAFMVQNVLPLLEKYKVNAYFCGHDHSMQHIKDDAGAPHFFGVGAANYADTSRAHAADVPSNSSKFFWPLKTVAPWSGSFAAVAVTKSAMTVQFIESHSNKQLYSTVVGNIRP